MPTVTCMFNPRQSDKSKGAFTMFRNYFALAIRTHIRGKFYTAINVGGLAIGIASCMIIMLFVKHETSYDTFNENVDRIYRVNTSMRFGTVAKEMALVAPLTPELFKQNYPEIESYTRIWNWGSRKVRRPEQSEETLEKMAWADSTLFKVFTFRFIEGDGQSALTEPNSIAINRTMSRKYFPEGDPVGKSLLIDDGNEKAVSYQVTAVFDDLPTNSHFHFDMFRSNTNLEDMKNVSLIGGGWMNTYLLLRKDASVKDLELKFPGFVEKYVAPQISEIFNDDFSMEKFKAEGNSWVYFLTPLKDIHLRSDLMGEFEANGDITYVYLFSAIGVFILVLACINFMNLSTAQSTKRAKEVGMRKVMGSVRFHLIAQFLTESFVLSILSFVLAVGVAWAFLPVFNNLAQKSIAIPFDNYLFFMAMAMGIVIVTVFAGLYPSFFLSSFKPIQILKGKMSMGSGSGLVRSGLVVFQFIISISLIVATIAIQKQLFYVQHKKIGFDKNQVIVVHDTHALGSRAHVFKQEALKERHIISATVSSFLPVSGTNRSDNTFWPEGKNPTGKDIDQMVSMEVWNVDSDYLKTLGMKIKTGRDFSPEFPADSTQAVILNNAAVDKFELGADPIGKNINTFTRNNPDGSVDMNSIKSWKVIGVVDDFHFATMRESISPLGLFLRKSDDFIALKFDIGHDGDVLESLENLWAKFSDGHTFHYSFLDEDYGRMYEREKRLGDIFALFAGLAIFIACLGLFALASFTAEQRTKEIGIRKSLGASVGSIVFLLSRSYVKLLLIAFTVSGPIAWYGVNKWIQGYAYRTTIGVEVYVFAGVVAGLVALLTIGYQCLSAARMNPVQSLRTE